MKLSIRSASKGLTPHSFNPFSATTLDFGELVPSRVIETLPGADYSKIHGSGALRLAPLTFPTYGNSFIKTAAFYVPEHQLFESSNAFHENMTTYRGKSVVRPFFNNYRLNVNFAGAWSTLVTSWTGRPSGNPQSTYNYDFITYDPSGSTATWKAWKLTSEGRKYFKLYKSLGYDFCSYPFVSSYVTPNVMSSIVKVEYDAGALLAYLKVYCDYFSNPNTYNNNPIVAFLQAVHDNESFSYNGNQWYDSTTGEIQGAFFTAVRQFMLLNHERNEYLTAWNNPNAPVTNTGNFTAPATSSLAPRAINGNAETFGSTTDTASYVNNNNSPVYSASQMRYLQAFDKFVRRWNLFGSKAVQRVYAKFGIKTDQFTSTYAHKLFEGSDKIHMSSIMSNSDTYNSSTQDGMSLGSYAGVGLSGLNFEFSHKSPDYGYIIVVHWIAIIPYILRGVHPHALRRKPFDFYQPDLDGKAFRSIPACEIAVDRNSWSDSLFDSSIYGYMNAYDDYRHMRDNISGDFLTKGVRDFLFCRDYSVLRELHTTNHFKPQTNNLQCYNDLGDITDPFQQANSNGDRFYLFLDYEINSQLPILSEVDSLDLDGEGTTQVELGGQMVN